MRHYIKELKDCEKGKDIYVLGSGASVDYYDPNFFIDRVVVAMNETCLDYRATYCVTTHHDCFLRSLGKAKCIVCEIDAAEHGGNSNVIDVKEDYWTFRIGEYGDFDGNLKDVGKDDILCLGNSTATMAINFAAHIGAKNIFLVGVDCCALDGKIHYSKYFNNDVRDIVDQYKNGTLEQFRHYTNDFLVRNTKEIMVLSSEIMLAYGCPVMSISPFIGLRQSFKNTSDRFMRRDMAEIVDEDKRRSR